jgi:hypothetical protein
LRGGAIGTLVERSTRYTMLVHLPGNHDAETVRDALIATMSTLPAHLRGSLTWDQGCEKAPTSASTAPRTSNTSPSNSTAAHAKHSTGKPQPSACVIYYYLNNQQRCDDPSNRRAGAP